MAFTELNQVLYAGDNIQTFTTNASVSAGMIVGFAATGVGFTVGPMDGSEGEKPIGVAIYGGASGDEIAVACTGCICYFETNTSAVDAGDTIMGDSGEAGCGIAVVDQANGSNVNVGVDTYGVVGIALEDVAYNKNTGRLLVQPWTYVKVTPQA